MHQRGRFPYAEVDGTKILQLPYVGDALAMTLVLPPEGTALPELEATLSPATLARWHDALRPGTEVLVALPRFKVATGSVALKPPLRSLGMKLPFDPRQTDFSALSPDDELYIHDAFHKVFVEVNEEGAEAAAATAIVMARESAAGFAFRADRPFLFLLRDTRTGDILFMGRVTNPNA